MGNDKNNIIDQLFSQHLSEAELPVRDSVWEGIAAQMENKQLRRKIFYARISAAASLLLLLGFGAWFFWQGPPSAAQFASSNAISVPQDLDSGAQSLQALASEVSPADPSLRFDALLRGQLGQFPRKGLASVTADGDKADPRPSLSALSIDQFGSPSRFADSKNNTSYMPSKALQTSGPLLGDDNASAVAVVQAGDVVADSAIGNVISFAEGVQKPDLDNQSPEFQRLESMMARKSAGRDQMELSPLVDEMFGNATAQHNEAESPAFDRFSVGAAFSPDMAFAATSPVQALAPNSRGFKLLDPADAEQSPSEFIQAFSTGVNFGYRLSERLGLQSGLFYSSRSSNTTSELDAFGKTNSFNSSFTVSFLEVPLLVQYDVVSRDNFAYYVSSGVSGNLLWDYDNTLSNPNGRVAARVVSADEDRLQPSQGNLLLRTGIRYKLLDHLTINIEPGVRYGILTNRYAFSDGSPASLSLSTGAAYTF